MCACVSVCTIGVSRLCRTWSVHSTFSKSANNIQVKFRLWNRHRHRQTDSTQVLCQHKCTYTNVCTRSRSIAQRGREREKRKEKKDGERKRAKVESHNDFFGVRKSIFSSFFPCSNSMKRNLQWCVCYLAFSELAYSQSNIIWIISYQKPCITAKNNYCNNCSSLTRRK